MQSQEQLMAKLSASSVHANFSHFYFGIFSENFLSVQMSIETPKNVFTTVRYYLVKLEVLFDMSSK